MIQAMVILTAVVGLCAWAANPISKCDSKQWECGMTAYGDCAQERKYWDENMTNYGRTGGWNVDVGSDEFKQCEINKKQACLEKAGC